MLEKIREGSQGVIAKTILVLVILSFAFAGVSSYLGTNTGTPAAIVNGDNITNEQLEQAFQNEKGRLKQQFGEMFDTLSADENYMNGIKKSVLERMVSDKLIDQAAVDLGLRVSDDQIKKAIFAEQAFQTDGKFDNERYLAVLRQLGYQTANFRTMMRTDMTRRQLVMAVVGSEFVLDGEATDIAKLQNQTRDIRYLTVDSTPFVADAKVSDEEAKTYFDNNKARFNSPEMVSLEYVELNAADMATEDATEEEAKAYYDEHKALYQTAEKRLAAHILIAAAGDDSAEKAKADAIETKLANGEDFAKLAETESDDKFSGKNGGQLDWFEKGVMDPEFDDALFSLEKGQTSKVVKTKFGYHVIKLLDVQASVAQSFADAKADILKDLKEKKAVDAFFSLQSKLADTSYEIPDTLTETSEAVNVPVKTTAMFSRNNVPQQFNTPDFVRAAFSEQVIEEGMNSDVIELGGNHVVVVRLKSHKPAGTMDFADVKDAIVNRLKQDKANDVARVKATEYMAKLKADDTIDAELTTVKALARLTQDTDPAIVEKAFKMPVPSDSKVSIDTAKLAQGYAIVVLDGVNKATNIEADTLASLKQRLSSQYSEANYRAVINVLKVQGKIEYPVAE
ncbi:SurA N-terminal domain-containing protein [Shewanella intestini]|uniref:Periplasmic chaperone PpiD n=1 Tax=Shewanella intestini TaxID=2017544 RepID=A0ABS5I7H8_9GAMM|nr:MULTISPECIES: SurA N-terminal domain-containing protein [Shewanella]MBR9729275.1 peptidylprolyl isomerase [Shewanella intestini]MRG35420.1 peptidylprolyl isomerase [Shewanella sp. XMDDZSB0408]